MSVRVIKLLVLLALPPLSAADDAPVYESHENVTLGRVFLSPAERDFLDAHRHLKPAAADATDVAGEPAESKPERPAAGYIIGPKGRSRIWQQGDFVATGSDTENLQFPGQIKVLRHVVKDGAGDEE